MSSSLDKAFGNFVIGLFVILTLYGLGMMIVLLFGGHEIALKLISVWSGMFSGVIGLGSGYLIGRASGSTSQGDE